MSQIFDKIRVGTQKRSTFSLSHNQVMTSDFGYLTPICVRDLVPNDQITVSPQMFVRLSPLAVPVYGSIKCRVHHFFVPYRILYPDWDLFISQDPNCVTTPPYYTVSVLRQALNSDPAFNTSVTNLERGVYSRLMANLGINPTLINRSVLPSGLDANDRISAMPFLAYYRIWLDWFMDSSINDHPAYEAVFKSDIQYGGSMAAYTKYLYTQSCCYKKDYFTTARLSPQGGRVNPTPYTPDPSIVGVDIASTDVNPGMTGSANQVLRFNNGKVGVSTSNSSVPSNATSKIGQFTIEALRAANSLQRWLERNNFVGSKRINRLLAHFGVAPTPERLDMAEFLGGDDMPVVIGDVTANATALDSQDDIITSPGYQYGKGVGAGSLKSVSYHAKEHGVFMSIMSIVPDTSYYQGIPRMFQKGLFGDALDFFHPEFENLGYQEILNKEVYVPSDVSAGYQSYDPDGVFGYSPRYSEYKFQQDILSGDFVTWSTLSSFNNFNLDAFHLFRKLDYDDNNPLALNENFVELRRKNTDYDRIFQQTSKDYDHFYFNINMDVKATRPMDGFTAPSLDHTNESDGNSINLPYGGTRL